VAQSFQDLGARCRSTPSTLCTSLVGAEQVKAALVSAQSTNDDRHEQLANLVCLLFVAIRERSRLAVRLVRVAPTYSGQFIVFSSVNRRKYCYGYPKPALVDEFHAEVEAVGQQGLRARIFIAEVWQRVAHRWCGPLDVGDG